MTLRETPAIAAAILIGVTGFLVFGSWTLLIPSNILWLNFGDMAMHQLGWMFYRNAPWGVPLGLSPDLGIEISNSVALVDGLPLFALPFKLLSPLFPQPMQYWGYWMLLSFSMQGLFGYLLARQLGANLIGAVFAAAFAVACPSFLFRAALHMALGGHFLVLAALWLFVKTPAPPRWAWPVLICVAASVHAYLLAIVLGLWVFSLLQRVLLKVMSFRDAVAEFLAASIPAAVVLWMAGFLMSGSLGSYGYGDYKLNLISLITPNNWSKYFPDVPHEKYDYEGLSFLGVGILGLLAIALVTGAFLKVRVIYQRRWWPLAVAILLMTIFALSNKIAFGDHDILVVPLPDLLEKFAEIFRSTGRFVWPLMYMLTIGIVVLVARRLDPWIFSGLAFIALAAQVADTAPKALMFHNYIPPASNTWASPMQSPVWERAVAAGYNRIRAIPLRIVGSDWKELGYFAVTHGMATDSIQLGRVDLQAFIDLTNYEYHALDTGDFEPRTIYVLENDFALKVAKHVQPDDLFANIDGRIVFARHGAALADGLDIVPPSALGG